ncbi:MAG: DUF3857 domain-containing protein [Gelidibacter sp.]|nr:DUF3857 domain-containing protein [Gelidibacter sp.]
MKKAFLILIFCVAHLSIAQNYKFGKVSEQELSQKTDPDYPEANAAILYRNQYIHFSYVQGKGFIQENEIQERIKIYNKEGFDYATKLIKLYANSEGSSAYDEKLIGLKAVTYNLEGNKIVEDKLKKDGIFDEVTNKYLETTKFTMPNIKEGCIIEFEYTIQSQRVGIDDIGFQQLIPIKKLEFKLKTPEYYKYKRLLNPRAAFVPNLTESKEKGQITFTSKYREAAGTGFAGGISTTHNTTSTLDYNIDVLTANLSDIPPLKDESYVDNLSNYQAKLIMELETVQFPGEPIKYLSTTWEKVTKTIYDDSEFGDQINKKGYYDNDLNAILTGVTDNQQKIDLIYNYVKSKVKWNDYNGYYTDKGVNKAYKEGIGNVADINLMLVSMLRYAGLNANPILVSTKSNGIPLIPTRSGFNYVICAIELDNNAVLLDASQKFATTNILPTKSLNWLGRLVREDGSSSWVELIPKIASKENVSLNIKLNTDLTASGKVRNQYTNYQAMSIRNKFENYNNDEMIESIEKGKGELEVSNFEIDNLKDVSQPITQSYEYTYNNALEDIGGKLYFTPMLFLASNENPFKLDKRNYPIDFVYPINDKYMINVMLPEGYVVESMPESVKFEFNGNEGQFSFIGKQNGSYLQFTVSLDLNTPLILPGSYEQFKKFYQLIVEKETEKVVLKKL